MFKKKPAETTAFELQGKLLAEFYNLASMLLDTGDYVSEKINNKIQVDNYKIFKKTRKVLWRKHKKHVGFFAVSDDKIADEPTDRQLADTRTA